MTAPIENPCQRWNTELDSVVAPCGRRKAHGASGQGQCPEWECNETVARDATVECVCYTLWGRVGDSTSRHYSKNPSRRVANRGKSVRRKDSPGQMRVPGYSESRLPEITATDEGLLVWYRALVSAVVSGLSAAASLFLASFSPFSNFRLGRTEVLGQLRNGGAPEVRDRDNNDNDQEIGPKNFRLRTRLLTLTCLISRVVRPARLREGAPFN